MSERTTDELIEERNKLNREIERRRKAARRATCRIFDVGDVSVVVRYTQMGWPLHEIRLPSGNEVLATDDALFALADAAHVAAAFLMRVRRGEENQKEE